MRIINIISLILLAIGGINWGLVGLFNLNLVGVLFGEGTAISAITYTLVGLAAIWQVFSFRWTIDREEEYMPMRQNSQQHA
jgi:uncharacterized membrane protein YuzA (DUF378 family)